MALAILGTMTVIIGLVLTLLLKSEEYDEAHA
jgi:hypothetical protein